MDINFDNNLPVLTAENGLAEPNPIEIPESMLIELSEVDK